MSHNPIHDGLDQLFQGKSPWSKKSKDKSKDKSSSGSKHQHRPDGMCCGREGMFKGPAYKPGFRDNAGYGPLYRGRGSTDYDGNSASGVNMRGGAGRRTRNWNSPGGVNIQFGNHHGNLNFGPGMGVCPQHGQPAFVGGNFVNGRRVSDNYISGGDDSDDSTISDDSDNNFGFGRRISSSQCTPTRTRNSTSGLATDTSLPGSTTYSGVPNLFQLNIRSRNKSPPPTSGVHSSIGSSRSQSISQSRSQSTLRPSTSGAHSSTGRSRSRSQSHNTVQHSIPGAHSSTSRTVSRSQTTTSSRNQHTSRASHSQNTPPVPPLPSTIPTASPHNPVISRHPHFATVKSGSGSGSKSHSQSISHSKSGHGSLTSKSRSQNTPPVSSTSTAEPSHFPITHLKGNKTVIDARGVGDMERTYIEGFGSATRQVTVQGPRGTRTVNVQQSHFPITHLKGNKTEVDTRGVGDMERTYIEGFGSTTKQVTVQGPSGTRTVTEQSHFPVTHLKGNKTEVDTRGVGDMERTYIEGFGSATRVTRGT